MKGSSLIPALVLGAGVALAAPFAYRVAVSEGMPSGFPGQVDRAFKQWGDVQSTTLKIQKLDNADVSFNWGSDGVEFNPDAATRTVITDSAASGAAPKVEVRFNPSSPLDRDSALFVEAGLRLGVDIDPAVDGKRALTETDAKTLRARYSPDGDLNGDGRIDIDDLELMAANFGKRAAAGSSVLGDLNGDGAVDDKDLEILKKNYSFNAPPSNAAPSNPTNPPTNPNAPKTPSSPPGSTPPTSPPAPANPTPPASPTPPTNPTPPASPTPPVAPPSPPPASPPGG